MKLLPIDINETLNSGFLNSPECLEILNVYSEFYKKVGFNPPWIGYFISRENEIVGVCGFKGKPSDNKVEIAYGTFKKYEGLGIGTEICKQIILLSLKSDSKIKITARTLPENNASTKILKKNNFVFSGMVHDKEDGDVWEWELL